MGECHVHFYNAHLDYFKIYITHSAYIIIILYIYRMWFYPLNVLLIPFDIIISPYSLN